MKQIDKMKQIKKPTEEEIARFNASVKSKNLKGQFTSYNKQFLFTKQQKEILIGTLLGDATIQVRQPGNCYIKFEQVYRQQDYLFKLFEIFQQFVGTGPKYRIIRNDFHKDYGVSCWFRTCGLYELKYYVNLFYTVDKKGKRKKIVPKNIHKLLTPIVLAYWFMDDGSSKIRPNGTYNYTLNTQNFTQSDQKILIKALKQRFDLDVTMSKDKKYYKLEMGSKSSIAFKALVEPHVLPSFKYKLK